GMETSNQLLGGQCTCANQFERDKPVQTDLACPKHDSHSPAGYLLQQFVIPEGPHTAARKLRPRQGSLANTFCSLPFHRGLEAQAQQAFGAKSARADRRNRPATFFARGAGTHALPLRTTPRPTLPCRLRSPPSTREN